MKIFKQLLLSSLLFVNCTADLVPVDYSEINPSIFPQTEKDLETLVNACYFPLRGGYSDGIHTTSENGVIWLDGTTEILRHNSAWHQLNIEKNNSLAIRYYDKYQNKISLMTLTLDQLQNTTIGTEEYRKKAIAEVRMARAMLSYILYDIYGPIVVAPIEVLKEPLVDQPLGRLTKEQMVAFIEEDLIEAAKDLPHPAEAEYGRFSKGIANMILIRLYLHEKNWQGVLKACKDIEDYNYYGLQSDYVAMWGLDGARGSKEVIWAIPCDYEGTSSNQWQLMSLPSVYKPRGGYGSARSTWYFYDSFEPTDIRKTNLIAEFSVGSTVYKREASNTSSHPLYYGPIPLKMDADENRTTSVSTVDIIVYRFADVILSKAEALANIAGAVTSEAVAELNKIRTRAQISTKQLSDFVDLQSFNDLILLERSHEYWCENGQYRADMIRMGKFISNNVERTGSRYADDNKKVFPFSQTIVNQGKGVFIQNPGYGE